MSLLPGKDAPLDETMQRMQAALQQVGVDIEEQDWLNPVPNVWSVMVRDRNCPLISAGGKGATREAALASALGECVERLTCGVYFASYYLGGELSAAEYVHSTNERWFPIAGGELPEGLLDDPTLCQYDMKGELRPEMLVDTNTGDQARGICALPFVRQQTGGEVWFPVNLINNLYAGNGMAAGNTVWEARVQALSEIFERHIKNTIISSGISLPAIPDDVVKGYPAIWQALESLRDYGFVVVVQDASLGGKYPLVNLCVLSPRTGACFASFGAHPKFEVALERAVTSLLQGRRLEELDEGEWPDFSIKDVAEQHNIEAHFIDSSGAVAWDLLSEVSDYEYCDWNVEGDSKAEFEHLCYLIHKVDMDIYIADYKCLGVDVSRIIVPGMSEFYPVDDLVWNNNNAGADLRSALFHLPELSEAQCQDLADRLDEQGFDSSQLMADLIGIVADEGTVWSELSVGELKCLLALAVSDHIAAREWAGWIVDSSAVNEKRQSFYRCLYQVLGFELDADREYHNFAPLMLRLYGAPMMSRVREIISGRGIFDDVLEVGGSLEGLQMHREMLSVYSRLRRLS